MVVRGDAGINSHGRLDVGEGSVMVVDPTDPDLGESIGETSRSGRQDGDS